MPQNHRHLYRTGLMAVSLSVMLVATPALAADAAKGKQVHQKNCTGCHDDSVYKRADRRVESLPALKQQITGCEHAANAKLSKGQIDDLTHYLNNTYYKFK